MDERHGCDFADFFGLSYGEPSEVMPYCLAAAAG